MPEISNNFRLGRMEKDLDDRLVPNGGYRDALNVEVATSEGSDVGALQKVLGNTLISGLPTLTSATCIGSVRDTQNNKIYWFITSSGADIIAEYDGAVIDLILVDTGSVLNFNVNNLVLGVNILDNVIYFTDNLNEPRRVDIEYWRGKTGTTLVTSTGLTADKITVIRKSPLNALTYTALPSTVVSGAGTIDGEQVQVLISGNTSLALSTFTLNSFEAITNITFIKQSDGSPISPEYKANNEIILTNTLGQTARIRIDSFTGTGDNKVFKATLLEIHPGIATTEAGNVVTFSQTSNLPWLGYSTYTSSTINGLTGEIYFGTSNSTTGTVNNYLGFQQGTGTDSVFSTFPVTTDYTLHLSVCIIGAPQIQGIEGQQNFPFTQNTSNVSKSSIRIHAEFSLNEGVSWTSMNQVGHETGGGSDYSSNGVGPDSVLQTYLADSKTICLTRKVTTTQYQADTKVRYRLKKTETTNGLSIITAVQSSALAGLEVRTGGTIAAGSNLLLRLVGGGSISSASSVNPISSGMIITGNGIPFLTRVVSVNYHSANSVVLDKTVTVSEGDDLTFNGTYSAISSNLTEYDAVAKEALGKFQEKFPTFSYRYKYTNNQYSTFAPFSLPAFVPGNFKYLTKDGFNAGMLNSITSATITGWNTDISLQFSNTANSLIKEIDILYKTSNDQNVYVVDTIKESGGNFENTYTIEDNEIYKVVESMQLLRNFDSVPRRSLAQEIVGNRIVYANYTENFNYTGTPKFIISTANITSDTYNQKLSIKSNRTYQFGIVFQDTYGRKTPVFTGTDSTIEIGKENSTNNIQFTVKTDDIVGTLPAEITHFKYFIKEISKEYYNIAISNYYDDGEGFAYLSIPSADRNKISENDYLVFKKQNGTTLSYSGTQDANRYKVIDIKNDPPQILNRDVAVNNNFGCNFGDKFGSQTLLTNKKAGMTPVSGFNKIQVAGMGESNYINAAAEALLKPGAKIRFKASTSLRYTKAYEVASVRTAGSSGSTLTAEVTFKNFFTEDVDQLYDDSNKILAKVTEFVTESETIGNSNFDGKFFVKIKANQELKDNFDTHVNEGDFLVLGSTYSVPAGSSVTGGYHLSTLTVGSNTFTITTSEVENHAASKYEDDNFFNNIVTGNYIRISDTNFNNELKFSNYYKITSVTKSNGGAADAEFAVTLATNLLVAVSTDQVIRLEVLNVVKESDSDSSSPAIFEIEPDDGLLDLYYETQETFPVSELEVVKTLSYANSINFGNGVESDRIRDDFNAPVIGKGVRVSTVIDEVYAEETLTNRFIYSQLYNSSSGVNRLNQFIIADKITKDINPSHGSIQLIKTRDTDLITLCEDKCFRVQANKDALFTADGNAQVTASLNVLGQVIPYVGEYGISKNPESFAQYGFRAFFTDRVRGVVLRLSRDGLSEISALGMSDFFSDKLANVNGSVFGSYDDRKNSYNLSFTNQLNSDTTETISFNEKINGWTSRKSFVPETAISLNNNYFSFKAGSMYKHHSNTETNDFYTVTTAILSQATSYSYEITLTQSNSDIAVGMYVSGETIPSGVTVSSLAGGYFISTNNLVIPSGTKLYFSSSPITEKKSSVKFLMNQPLGQVKRFKTLNYQGDTGWLLNSISTPEHVGEISSDGFIKKEGKYFATVNGKTATASTLNAEELQVEGLGTVDSVVGKVLTFNDGVNSNLQVGDNIYFLADNAVASYTLSGACTVKTATTITIPANGTAPAVGKFVLFDKGGVVNQSGLLGFFAEVEMKHTTTSAAELFSVGSLVV
jgi:hypothetical protein